MSQKEIQSRETAVLRKLAYLEGLETAEIIDDLRIKFEYVIDGERTIEHA